MDSRDWAIRQVSLKESAIKRVDAARSVYAVGRVQNKQHDTTSRDQNKKKPIASFKKIYMCKINKDSVDCRI